MFLTPHMRRIVERMQGIHEAAKARCYFSAAGYGTDRGVIVYDLKARQIVFLIGYFPERHRPAEGVSA